MKWFTEEYLASDEPDKKIWQEYQDYIQTIKEQLPGNLAELCDFSDGWAGHTQLPDGNIMSIVVDAQAQTTVIEMEASYWKVETCLREKARHIWLRYFDVIEYRLVEPRAALVPGTGDNAFDEVELISPGIFEHRLLFHSGVEITIRFRDFRLDYENLE